MRRVTFDDAQRIKRLYRAIRLRTGVTDPRAWLAYKVGTSGAYVSRMLNGEQRTGRKWAELIMVLTPDERELVDPVAYRGTPRRLGALLNEEENCA
jgi:hypothetical protein